MKKMLLVALVAGFVGFIAGNAFWYLFSPLWIDMVVNEQLIEAEEDEILALGMFEGADSVHQGKGTVEAIDDGEQMVLNFTEFEVTNGPDLYVWLVKTASPENSDAVKNSEWVELGRLKGNIGDQFYQVPEGVNIGEYGSVVIWCKQFGVLFASANI